MKWLFSVCILLFSFELLAAASCADLLFPRTSAFRSATTYLRGAVSGYLGRRADSRIPHDVEPTGAQFKARPVLPYVLELTPQLGFTVRGSGTLNPTAGNFVVVSVSSKRTTGGAETIVRGWVLNTYQSGFDIVLENTGQIVRVSTNFQSVSYAAMDATVYTWKQVNPKSLDVSGDFRKLLLEMRDPHALLVISDNSPVELTHDYYSSIFGPTFSLPRGGDVKPVYGRIGLVGDTGAFEVVTADGQRFPISNEQLTQIRLTDAAMGSQELFSGLH